MKGKVRDVLHTGGIVPHHIVRAGEILHQVAVSLLALEETGVVAEVRSQTIRGDGPLGLTGDSRGVVAEVQHGRVGGVVGG